MFSTPTNHLPSWDISTWAAVVAAIAALIPIITDWWRSRNLKSDKKKLEDEFGKGVYLPEDIELSLKYYVEPNCSSNDPALEDESWNLVAPAEKFFTVLDNFLSKDSKFRHMIILADSGMGKTTALINYYARNCRRKNKHKIALIPLGLQDADMRITQLISNHNENVTNIVLFLDAFDEDTLAIIDHKERLADLMNTCRNFNRIVLTCRTQFFLSDAEIPTALDVVRIAPRSGSAKYTFQQCYLMPFSNRMITKYLRKRFRWNWIKRRKAKEIVNKVPKLNMRPMLLTYMPDLLEAKMEFKYSYELYEMLINSWLRREDYWVQPEALRNFSERLAIDLFINRKERGQERVNVSELVPLANKWGVDLDNWQITGRSLLNRDANGNYKFAHRSIMEYLFLTCNPRHLDIDWDSVVLTDQMQFFISEAINALDKNVFKNIPKAYLRNANLCAVHLNGINLSGADLREANLSEADLREANLSGADLREANLSGADLREANLSGADLREVDLSEVKLQYSIYNSKTQWPKSYDYRNSQSIGPRANLASSNLIEANLRSVDLSEANLFLAKLCKADLHSANLYKANLHLADLSRADLSGADLREADLRGTNLEDVNLAGAILLNTYYNSSTCWPKDFDLTAMEITPLKEKWQGSRIKGKK